MKLQIKLELRKFKGKAPEIILESTKDRIEDIIKKIEDAIK